MTLQEAATLFNAPTTDHFRLFLIMSFATVQRPVNILELKTDQIDIENRVIDFNPPDAEETNKRRPVVAICDTLLPWLKDLEPGFVIRWKKHQTKPIGGIKTAIHRGSQSCRAAKGNHAVHDSENDGDRVTPPRCRAR